MTLQVPARTGRELRRFAAVRTVEKVVWVHGPSCDRHRLVPAEPAATCVEAIQSGPHLEADQRTQAVPDEFVLAFSPLNFIAVVRPRFSSAHRLIFPAA